MHPFVKATFSFRLRFGFLLLAACLCRDLPAAEPTASLAQPLTEPLPRVPPTEPGEAAKTFQVLHGFRMELLAAEPLVTDPVAMAYDEDGRAYVCEMNDYPYTDKAHHKPAQENPTDQPIGKVRLLIDTDGDGRFDKNTVFAEGLSWPSGVACWKGGVFVSAPPDLWYFKDTTGDGVADVRVKVFTGFRKLNVQAVMNNPIWGLDNRIYGAGSSNGGELRPGEKADAKPLMMTRNDFRFDANDPAKTFELLSGGARFGNSFDDWGNRFLCNIRNPAEHVVLPSRYLARNPFLPVRSPINDIGPSGEVPIYRISPVEPWRELRARRWAGERDNPAPSSELVPGGMVTSSSGITIYRGAAYPKEFRGNAFTAEPGNNVFYRQTLTPDGPTFKAERVDAPHEMAASTDIWFRAVNFVNAPDGTLHVCDMYRENIEHPWSIPDDIHAAVDLESGRDRGRIWRLAPPGFTAPKPPRLSKATAAELVATLENPNSWWRETAQRLLFERQDASAAAPLRALLERSAAPLARLHAMWTLEGLHQLTDDDIARGLADKSGGVREHAVKLAESRLNHSPALLNSVLALAKDPEIRVRFQAAFTLGETKDARAGAALALIAKRDAADPWLRAAVLSSAAESCDRLLAGLLSDTAFAASAAGRELISQIAFVVGARNRPAEIARVLASVPDAPQLPIASQVAAGLGDGLKRSGRSLRKVTHGSGTIDALLDDAPRRASDAQASLAQREQAIRLLGYDEFDRVQPALTALLDARQPAEVQRAAVQALAGFNHPDIAKILLDPWRIYTPNVRSEVVQSLLGFKNRILPLLDAIQDGRVAANQIPPARRALLLRNKDPKIQGRAAKLLGATAVSPRKEVIDKYKVALTLKGDAQRGQAVFETNCMICHRVGDKGTDAGPNLSTVRQWSAEQMMVNILDPNREVAPNFIQYVIELKDSQTVVGLIADETPTSINLRNAGNVQQTVLRQNIASMTSLGMSLMPEGVEANINPQQMADLLALLREPDPRPSAPSALPLSAATPPAIVAFGDSTTAPRGRTEVYATVLANELTFEGAPVRVINSGVGGHTTKEAKMRFEKDVLAHKPEVAIIQFGINDAAVDVWKKPPASAPRVPLPHYRANLTAVVQALKQSGARVVLMTPNALSWTPTLLKLYSQPPYQADDPDGMNVLLRDYAEAVRGIARDEGVGLVDVFAAFKKADEQPGRNPGWLCPDGMHPGDDGHRLVADLLIEHLSGTDKRFARKPFTVWTPSGEVNKVNPRATDITHDAPGPAVLGPSLVKLDGGAVMSVYSTPTSYKGKPGECYIAGRITRDGGKTWEPERELTRLPQGRAAHPTVHRTRDGTIHVFFLGYQQHAWDKRTGNPTERTRSDLWTSRSRDRGKTWSEPQMIFEGYTGSTNGAEESHDGRLVVPFSHYVANPGRLVSRTVVSSDGGRTWKLSNALDIGGAGDHEGALEPCVIELKDRRLWMLIRTPRGFFWESFSTDGGLTWTAAAATPIASSHSPGHIIRLADGRLALAWNPAHCARRELHLALSNDEGRTWTPSLIAVRGSTTYPFILEAKPGELWVGFMDSHTGWGTAPRARHFKIAEQVLLDVRTETPAAKPSP